MNYAAHYERLIDRAHNRILEGYRERHHILPKCMGGGNEASNIVELTAEEHYVAHQLLVKMHPSVRGLAIAAFRMAKQCTGNKAYGWIQRRMSKAKRGAKQPPEAIAKRVASNKGKKRTAETRAKMSAVHLARQRLPFSDAQKAHLRKLHEAQRGRTYSPETIAKLSTSNRGQVRSPEARAKMSAAGKGRKLTPEHCANIAAGHIGIKHSIESRTKMSALARNRPKRLGHKHSAETRAKLSVARRKTIAAKAIKAHLTLV